MRYIIGIDLGTTNCCVAYLDTASAHPTPQLLRIPQLVAAGHVAAQEVLPSYCYLAADSECPEEQMTLPWGRFQGFLVGEIAQNWGAKAPGRLVSSAKSWLCYGAADRRSAILPAQAPHGLARISPVEASSRYLAHIRDSWNHLMAKGEQESEFSQQQIVVTIPASFDEVARQLTAEAARLAGFSSMTLLEEPQAAFYSWLAQNERTWQKKVRPTDRILVCDVGGGTTDFSLIDVVENDEKISFQRMAVGEHLLLGGDNIDAALAHHLEAKLKGCTSGGSSELTPLQWHQLSCHARNAKETLLGAGGPDKCRITLQGSGSSIVHGSLSVEISRDELLELLLQGFFPTIPWDSAIQLHKARGIRSMGLPYEDDPSITKQLAHFLATASPAGQKLAPDLILFNGGTMHAAPFRQAIIDSLNLWFPGYPIRTLETISLDTAVARGAAYYGKVRSGGAGIKIGGGLPRTFYLGVALHDSSGNVIEEKALTLVPRGSEEGYGYEPDWIFSLTPNTPIAFHLYASHTRFEDNAGDLISIDPAELHQLPPLHTILSVGKRQPAVQQKTEEKIPVHVSVTLTALGTIDIAIKAVKNELRWSLEFQVRNVHGQEDALAALSAAVPAQCDVALSSADTRQASELVTQAFAPGADIEALNGQLEQLFDAPRKLWQLSALRSLWEALLKSHEKRQSSATKESRWWNLTGFCLRPGYGYPLDDFRLKALWKLILAEKSMKLSSELLIQRWICYRRVAGGLNKGQQMQLAAELFHYILPDKREKKGVKINEYAYSECIRAIAALERIDIASKIRLGEHLVKRICSKSAGPADLAALARLGGRHLSYGAITDVVPGDIAAKWVEALLSAEIAVDENSALLLTQLARPTGVRAVDLPSSLWEKAAKYLESKGFSAAAEAAPLTEREQEQLLGDRLPLGLSLGINNNAAG